MLNFFLKIIQFFLKAKHNFSQKNKDLACLLLHFTDGGCKLYKFCDIEKVKVKKYLCVSPGPCV